MNEEYILKILGRETRFLDNDYINAENSIKKIINNSNILVLGGAGSIGSKVVKELCRYDPKLLHVVDINENDLVELVRDIRSSLGYIKGEFETFAIDIGSKQFEALIKEHKNYDIWLNFSALKHVRSEKDPFTLMRLIEVNIINTFKTLELATQTNAKVYFSVSTDKAANPVNFMGASKRAMELILGAYSKEINVCSARFGNVAFSNGSLLRGMINRFDSKQPLVAPKDIKRFFLTPLEAAQLSIISFIFSRSGEVYIPLINGQDIERNFPEIVNNFLQEKGFKMYITDSEKSARSEVLKLIVNKNWPCYIFETDTTGEKLEEVFIGDKEELNQLQFSNIGSTNLNNIKNKNEVLSLIDSFINLQKNKKWSIDDIKHILQNFIENFNHKATGKYLEKRM